MRREGYGERGEEGYAEGLRGGGNVERGADEGRLKYYQRRVSKRW